MDEPESNRPAKTVYGRSPAGLAILKKHLQGKRSTPEDSRVLHNLLKHSEAGQELTAPTRKEFLEQQPQKEAEVQRREEGGDKPIERKVTGDQIDC